MPVVSRAVRTALILFNKPEISPSEASILFRVGTEIFALSASSLCVILSKARAAEICLPVSKVKIPLDIFELIVLIWGSYRSICINIDEKDQPDDALCNNTPQAWRANIGSPP